MNARRLTYYTIVLLVIALCLWPLINLIYIGVRSFSFDLIFNKTIYEATVNTFTIAGLTMFFTLILGTVTAFYVARTNIPYKNLLRTILLYPYLIPSYLIAVGWIILANPTVGYLNSVLPIFNIYGIGGIVFVETMVLYTFVFLNVFGALTQMDGSLEESARLCGASPFRIFFDITLPLLKSTLVGSGLVVFLSSLSSFGVPAMIGGPAKKYVLTTYIYQIIKAGTTLSLAKATALSLPVVLVAYLLLYTSQKILKKKNFKTLTGKHNRKVEINLRWMKWPSFFIFILFSFLTIGLPVNTIIIFSFLPRYGVWDFTLDNYRDVLFDPSGTTLEAFKNSLCISLGCAFIIAIISLLIAYYSSKSKYRMINTLSSIAALPYAIPGTILALAIMFTFGGFNPIVVLMTAFIAKYLSFGVKIMTPAVGSVDSALEEASLVCGASWTQTIRKIWWPIMRPAITSTCFLVFSPLFCELTMSILLIGPSTPTLGARLFQLNEFVGPTQSTVLSVIVLAIVITLNIIIKKLSKGKLGV